MSLSTPTKLDGRAVLFEIAELLVLLTAMGYLFFRGRGMLKPEIAGTIYKVTIGVCHSDC